MQNKYDVVVIGAGSGGLTAASGFSKFGKKVLLVEKEKMGGECTNSGCIPSKTLLHLAKEYFNAKTISEDGSNLEGFKNSVLQKVRNKIGEVYREETPEVFEKRETSCVECHGSGITSNMILCVEIGLCCSWVHNPNLIAWK